MSDCVPFCLQIDGIIIDRCDEDKDNSIETWKYNLSTESVDDRMYDSDGKTKTRLLSNNTLEDSDEFGYQKENPSYFEGMPIFFESFK